jgi:hypothetical protein
MRVLKYTLGHQQLYTTLEVPKDSQVLKVGEQNGTLVAWVQTPDTVVPETFDTVDVWRFLVVATGEFVEDTTIAEYDYLDTVQMNSGFVWHVFIQWSHQQ